MSNNPKPINLRLSEILLGNKHTFTSDHFKNTYIINKEKNKYFIDIDQDIFSIYLQITKLVKLSNYYSINSIPDYYILQILLFENEIGQLNDEKQKNSKELKKKDTQIESLLSLLKSFKERETSQLKDDKAKESQTLSSLFHELKDIERQLRYANNEFNREDLLCKISNCISKMSSLSAMQDNTNFLRDNSSNTIEESKVSSYNKPQRSQESHLFNSTGLKHNIKSSLGLDYKIVDDFETQLNKHNRRFEKSILKTDYTKINTRRYSSAPRKSGVQLKTYVEYEPKKVNWKQSLRSDTIPDIPRRDSAKSIRSHYSSQGDSHRQNIEVSKMRLSENFNPFTLSSVYANQLKQSATTRQENRRNDELLGKIISNTENQKKGLETKLRNILYKKNVRTTANNMD